MKSRVGVRLRETSFRQCFQVFHELWIQKPPDDVRVSGDCGIIPFNLLLGTVTAGPLYKASGSFFNIISKEILEKWKLSFT
jgi:hypothetical protein